MAGTVRVCDIPDSVTEALKKFRFRKHDGNSALIVKVEREHVRLCVEDELDDVTMEDLQEILPGHQPRYIIYSYKMWHADGRTSYPILMIYYTPRDAPTELQLMYAGTKRALAAAGGLTRVCEARELDEMTEQWLRSQIK